MAVTAVLLAAGASTRFGAGNKLLAEIGGEAMVARVARALLCSQVGAIIVVTPPDRSAIAAALARVEAGGRLSLIANPDPSRGIASSIATGIFAVDATSAGVMIVPGDMPDLAAADFDRLLAAFVAEGGDALVHAATAAGRQRNPVVWPRRLFGALAALQGDVGGKPLIAGERAVRPDRVVAVAFADEAALRDVDRPEDLARPT
ncbi:MAG: nucleotidyltransferase family protein [Hyphomicrobium sp.]